MAHGQQTAKACRGNAVAKDLEDFSCMWISEGKSFDPRKCAQKHGVKIDTSWKTGDKDILGNTIPDCGLKVDLGQAPDLNGVKTLVSRFVRTNAEFIRDMQKRRATNYVSIMFGLYPEHFLARYVTFDSRFIQLLSSKKIQLQLFACICSDTPTRSDSGRSMRSRGSNRKRRVKQARR